MEQEKPKLKPMCRLTKEQIQQKKLFFEQYAKAANPASGSAVDANANVVTKTVNTAGMEAYKDFCLQVNRSTMKDKIEELFGAEEANLYIELLENHDLYKHDETPMHPATPYCVAISMAPFIEHGMTQLGGESKAPQHVDSFCGSFINLAFAISSQFAGAVSTVEVLTYLDFFCRKDWGENYLETHREDVKSKFQHIVYSLNQPAAARGYQSIFWNISIFDKYYFEAIFKSFIYPDGTLPKYESIRELQYYFMEWFTQERHRSLLTFPVVTESSLNNEDGTPKDEEFARRMAQFRADGLSFFSYNDTNAAALSSCCRLRNAIENDDEDNTFAYTLGGVGVATGSTSVMTFNFNRLVQTALFTKCGTKNHKKIHEWVSENPEEAEKAVMERLEWIASHIYKFQKAHRELVEEAIKDGLLPAYSAGYIHTFQQFCTLGINGLNEGAEYLGYKCSNNDAYKNFVARVFGKLTELNKAARKIHKIKFNSELIPGENLGVKNAAWDKKDGLETRRNCYNSYIYLPEDTDISIPDKFQMHGRPFSEMADGGSALHLNIANLPDADTFYWLRCLAGKTGTQYWTTNVLGTCCDDCGWIDFRTLEECPKCKGTNLDYMTRVVGFCKRLSSYGSGRREEAARRFYH